MKVIFKILFHFLLIPLVVSASGTSAREPFKLKSPYVSGKTLCSGQQDSLNAGEHGYFVSVSVDYRLSLKGTTEVYAWTFKDFDSSKPTAIVFGGGPGENLHEGPTMLDYFPANWNIVFFDPRGMLCSRPANSSLLQDYQFVSSEIIAHDAQEIAKYLNLKNWTAFGSSYGTVAATIAGHLFPNSIQAVVLQGTIFTSSNSDADLIPIAQKIFDELPSDQKEKIISISARTDIEMIQEWAFDFIFLGSYGNDLVSKRFSKLFSKPEHEIISDIKEFLLEIKNDNYEFADDEKNSSWLRTVLICREKSDLRVKVQFQNGKFSSTAPTPDEAKVKFCQDFSIPLRIYESRKYPLKVPVTYFQGKLDMATPFDGAYRHFHEVASGPAQFIYAQQGGHMLMNPADFGASYYDLLKTAFAGKNVPHSLIRKSNLESRIQLKKFSQ